MADNNGSGLVSYKVVCSGHIESSESGFNE